MSFPDGCYSQLCFYWGRAITGLSTEPAIWFSHRQGTEYAGFSPFGGVQAARESLMLERKPILVFGFQSAEFVRSKADEYWPGSGALFDWPGAAYLRYDVSEKALRATALRIIEGFEEPFPEGLVHDPAGLRRLSQDIRHWLGNLKKALNQTLANFQDAAGGSAVLSRFHLNPVSAMSADHEEMLKRLWSYEGAGGLPAPALARLATLKATMAAFQSGWEAFEASKVAFRAGGTEQMTEIVVRIEDILSTLDTAIEAALALDAAVVEKE